jgi:hypothetical protein
MAMIEYKPAPLAQEQELALRRWLDRGECSTLEMVVESRARSLQIDALNESRKAADPNGALYLDKANAQLQKANRYATFLAVLNEIKTHTEAFTVVRIT